MLLPITRATPICVECSQDPRAQESPEPELPGLLLSITLVHVHTLVSSEVEDGFIAWMFGRKHTSVLPGALTYSLEEVCIKRLFTLCQTEDTVVNKRWM